MSVFEIESEPSHSYTHTSTNTHTHTDMHLKPIWICERPSETDY